MSDSTTIPQRVHLVGIGGMHMSAIARILLSRGHQVSGSDIRATALTDTLQQLGARIVIGPHDAASVGDAEFVVTTSAATSDNPELNEARSRGIPLIKRADMVAKLMEGLVAVCVAGCHGKSTTSGLVAFILEETGFDPTYLIGAEVADLGDNAKPGSGPHVVVEADEYDRAFLSYNPDVAVVTNVEADHLDYYKTWEAVQEAFRGFAARVVPGGTLLLCADNDEATALRDYAQPGVNLGSYGFKDGSDWQAVNVEASEGRQSFTVLHNGNEFGVFSTLLAGRHNVQNALGAIAMCATLGLDATTIAGALTVYTGVRRRFEWVGEEDNIIVMDDYAHHPTEIEALAQSARSRFPGRRIVVCFQPHTFARTRYLLDAFKTCFRGFDRLFLLETYAAREAIADGMTAKQLSEEVRDPEPTYVSTFEEAAERVAAELRPGDVFFTVGAGDLDVVGPMVLDHLRAKESSGA